MTDKPNSIFGPEVIRKIVEPFKLTPRELDIVLALADGKVTAREIAKHLHVSESTINNHIDNISHKTGLGGKAEILSFIVQKLFVFVENSRFFMTTPHVLVLDDHEDLADSLTETFRNRGCQTMTAYQVDELLFDRLEQSTVDLIVCDYNLRDTTGIEFLSQLSQRIRYLPASVLISGSPPDSQELPLGAYAWLRKPFDQHQLFQLAIEAFINSDRRAGRKERILFDREDAKVSIGRNTAASAREISETGMLIETNRLIDPNIGKESQFELEMPDKTRIPGSGTIIHAEQCPQSGVMRLGIKFTQISPEQKKFIQDYVHARNILKFLPVDHPVASWQIAKKRGA